MITDDLVWKKLYPFESGRRPGEACLGEEIISLKVFEICFLLASLVGHPLGGLCSACAEHWRPSKLTRRFIQIA
jgi:hypothetical protein